jgi:hypothetical protein
MTPIITLINKKTHASNIVSGQHVPIAQPSVVEVSVDNANDIAGLHRQGNALVIVMRSGEIITLDDFYLLDKDAKDSNSLVIQDAHGLSTPVLDAAGAPVLDEGSFTKIESIQSLLDSTSPDISGWWLAGAALLAGGVALAAGGGGGGQ